MLLIGERDDGCLIIKGTPKWDGVYRCDFSTSRGKKNMHRSYLPIRCHDDRSTTKARYCCTGICKVRRSVGARRPLVVAAKSKYPSVMTTITRCLTKTGLDKQRCHVSCESLAVSCWPALGQSSDLCVFKCNCTLAHS